MEWVIITIVSILGLALFLSSVAVLSWWLIGDIIVHKIDIMRKRKKPLD